MLELLAENKKAYSLRPLFKLEGGLVLTGSEAKAIKEKNLSLGASYAKFMGGELYLIGLKLGRYKSSSDLKFEAEREKKVLLKKSELVRLGGLLAQKGLVLIPGKLYVKNNFIKVELLVGRVLRKWEKRDKARTKDLERETNEYFND